MSRGIAPEQAEASLIPRIPDPLAVFISSTGDLVKWRDAAQDALRSLYVHERRYETLPSSSNGPLQECLKQVRSCSAMILILGARYGSLAVSGRSFTHEEYLEARRHALRVFAYRLELRDGEQAETRQVEFISEVEGDLFRCAPVADPEALAREVKASLAQAFHDAFRESGGPPSRIDSREVAPIADGEKIKLPEDKDEALELLQRLYRSGGDITIHSLATKCELLFADDAPIMGVVYSAEVNLANRLVPEHVDRNRLGRAVEFWSREDIGDGSAESRAGQLYNKANALDALERYPEAIEAFEAALREIPDFAKCWKNLGSAYDKAGDVRRSIECLERSVELEPTLVEALLSLGAVLIEHDIDPGRG